MRQAGRYLPEYRATRARAGNFLAMCTNPDIACEVTLQPIDRYPLDAAILFSDILTIPHAMNLGLEFEAGEGPKFERPVRTAADIAALGVPDPGQELKYVIDAVALVRAASIQLGGKGGGGRRDMAQAGGPDGGAAEAALGAVSQALRETASVA